MNDRGNSLSPTMRRLAGVVCLFAGLGLVGRAAAIAFEGAAWQRQAAVRFEPSRGTTPAVVTSPEAHDHRPAPGEPLTRLRVDRLGIDVVVAEGSDAETLNLGPGHLRESAYPGSPGNSIIAGHRDGAFGQLRAARLGDVIELNDGNRPLRYRIVSIDIVDRHDRRLLAPSGRPILTLVTCYPFRYVGPAPERYVVRAEPEEMAAPLF